MPHMSLNDSWGHLRIVMNNDNIVINHEIGTMLGAWWILLKILITLYSGLHLHFIEG